MSPRSPARRRRTPPRRRCRSTARRRARGSSAGPAPCGGPPTARCGAGRRTWWRWPAARAGRCGASGWRSTRRRVRSAPPPSAASPSGSDSNAGSPAWCWSARRAAPPGRTWSGGGTPCAGPRWRCARMSRSGRWSVATPWWRTTTASRWPPLPRHAPPIGLAFVLPMAESERDPNQSPDSYEAVVERLEQIIDRLDSGQAGLRETLELCGEGRELVTYCAAELDAVGEGLKELRLDELAERLAAGTP